MCGAMYRGAEGRSMAMAIGRRCSVAMAMIPLAMLLLSLLADANSNNTNYLLDLDLDLDLERSWGNLSVDFHAQSCPQVEWIVSTMVYEELQADRSLASGLIRLYFNDCFLNVSTLIRTASQVH